MSTFENFPKKAQCPICGTNENKECVLVPISGAGKDGCDEAKYFHLECVQKTWRYYEDKQAIVSIW